MLQYFFVETDTNILCFHNMSENNQTMGHTLADKGKLGKDWIDKLDLSYVCRTFHGQLLICICICELLHEELVAIKEYFKNLVDVFWIDDHHIANRTKAEEIGTCLGHFLLPSCTLNSQRPVFQF